MMLPSERNQADPLTKPFTSPFPYFYFERLNDEDPSAEDEQRMPETDGFAFRRMLG